MTKNKYIGLAALGLAGLALAGCSSSDNLEEWTYATFPVINTTPIIPALNEYSDLADVEQLTYQAALIYDTVLEPHGYDEIVRSLPSPSERERGKWLRCPIDGRIWYGQGSSSGAVSGLPHLGTGTRVASQVNVFGCNFTDDQTPPSDIITHGGLLFVDAEVEVDEESFDAHYTTFENYALQYISEPAEGETLTRRAEIDGFEVEGPITVDADDLDGPVVGGSFEGDTAIQVEHRQRLRYATYIHEDDGSESDPTIVVVHRGLTSGGSFRLRRDSATAPAFRLAGPLTSASTIVGQGCGHGRIDISTVAELALTGDDISQGELMLRGDVIDEDEEVEEGEERARHTVVFAFNATGDIEVLDGEGAFIADLARGDIEAVRNACFQTVPVRY